MAVRLTLCLACLAMLSPLAAHAQAVHWFEAEDYNGNGRVVDDPAAAGGQYVEARTWHVLAKAFAFPRQGGPYEVWGRLWNDLPAGWYVQDWPSRQVKHQAFHAQAETWSWVRLGRYHPDEVGEKFWGVHLGTPQDRSVSSALGRLDAIVVAESIDVATLEALTKQKAVGQVDSATDVEATQRLAALRQSRRAVHIPLVSGRPALDGQLNDAFWQHAAKTGPFVTLRAQGLPTQRTEVLLAAGDDALYVGVVLHERLMRFIQKVKTLQGDSVWTDDVFELFIDPAQTFQESHHFIVNPLGTTQDNLARLLDRADGAQQQGSRWQAVTQLHEDRWVVEMALPWATLGVARPQPGQVWNINFARAERPHSELSYWNNTDTYFLQPARMGLAVFGRPAVELVELDLDDARSRLVVRTRSGDDAPFDVSLSISQHGRLLTEHRQHVTPDTTRTAEARFALQGLTPGHYDMVVTLPTSVGVDQAAASSPSPSQSFRLPLVMYSDSLASVAWPPEIRDNVLHMARGTTQHCFFVLANHSPQPIGAVDLVVLTPPWLTVLDPRASLLDHPSRYFPITHVERTDIEKDGQTYRQHRLRIGRPIPVARLESRAFYQSVLLFFAIDPQAALSDQGELPGDVTIHYHLESAGHVEPSNAFTLRTLPALRGRQPARWLVHNWLWTINPNPTTWQPMADTLRQAGFNSVDADNREPDYIAALRRQGIGLINNMYWYWWFPDHAKANPQDIALDYEGHRLPDGKICPTVLLEDDGKLARQALEPTLARVRQGLGDGVVWNLEGPSAWNACFCPRCLDAFKAEAGLAANLALTPRLVRQSHSPAWVRFASGQSTRFLAILRQELRRINPAAVVSIYSGNPGSDTQTAYRVDWSQAARHLDATFMSYYAHSPTALDHTFNQGMKRMIAQVKQWAGRDDFRAIATLTPGYQRGEPLQPSADLLGMQVIRSLASGADGVSFWWWGPFDGLYYTRLADATRVIARVEPFIHDGQPDAALADLIQGPAAQASWEVLTHQSCHLVILMNHHAQNQQTFDLSALLSRLQRNGAIVQNASDGKPLALRPGQASLALPPLGWQALVVGEPAALKRILREP